MVFDEDAENDYIPEPVVDEDFTYVPPPPIPVREDDAVLRARLAKALKTLSGAAAAAAMPEPVKVIPPPPPMDFGATIYPALSRENAGGGAVLDKWHIVVVGAGGVGARLVPMLVKHLSNGDRLSIIDGDRVEAKNLMRQHFVADDIGQYKAQIVAERAKLTAPRSGIDVGFVPSFITAETAESIIGGMIYQRSANAAELYGETLGNHSRSLLLITAVDTLAARKLIRDQLRDTFGRVVNDGGNSEAPQSVIWIDCGNAMNSGQAMLAALFNQGNWKAAITGQEKKAVRWDRYGLNELWNSILPDFLNREDPPPAEGVDACAIRMDTQSVLANAWASMAAATLAIPIISHAGIKMGGLAFSTSGTTITAPISQQVVKVPHNSPDFKWVSRKLA